jgi:hypothetical protein
MIAYQGETVTCENGHEICEVAEDVSRYSGAKAELSSGWRMGDPPPGVEPMR